MRNVILALILISGMTFSIKGGENESVTSFSYEVIHPSLNSSQLKAHKSKAEKGNGSSMDVLFYAYFRGFGEKDNRKECLAWLKKGLEVQAPPPSASFIIREKFDLTIPGLP